MRLGILGPLSVADDQGREFSVAAPRHRALLAALLVHANELVSVDALAELVWDGTPPGGAAGTLRSYLARLRRAVGPDVAARMLTREPGYLCQLTEDELDVLRFEALCREGGAALRDRAWQQAQRTLTEALGLWRGALLADVASRMLREQCAPRLEQARLEALEWRIEADLHLGCHDRLVPELQALVGEHPLRETFHAQLMLTLYRAGRQAEALVAFQRARRILVDELGVEPGPQLQRLHQRILTGDAGLLAPTVAGPAATAAPRSVVPRQLSAAIPYFTGRSDELRALSGLLSRMSDGGGAVVISAIGGTAGIGKTALAVHWAHLNGDRFPDGQLHVDLRGFDPSDSPMAPADAIRGFLTALGVPVQRIPADPHTQVAFYRSQMADRRMLVLLDNARDAEQVRPLLPGASGCLVLVTSRSRLTGPVALNGAIPVMLGLFTPDEARELLTRRLGTERVTHEQRAVEELIELCARLPLALNIAAAYATLHPARPLSGLVDELREARRRLDVLSAGTGAADVRAVFSWSYRTLDPETARVFRLLSLHPGPDIGVTAAAGLAALDLERTRGALDALVTAGLLAEYSPGRYGFHDLLRTYAADQTQALDSEAERDDALWRVCDFYIHTAHDADRLLAPHHPAIPLEPPAPGTRAHPLDDASAAMAWFDAERPNLLAAQHAARSHAWHDTVWQLAWGLDHYHYRQRYLREALAMWRAALESVELLPSPAARILVHQSIGRSYAELGRHNETIEHVNRALALADHHRDPVQQAYGHLVLMRAWERHGDDSQALHHATRARDFFRTLDQPTSEAMASNAVGWLAAHLGDYDTARTHCTAALALHRRHHDVVGEMAALYSLGYIDHHTGRYPQAVEHYQRTLALLRSHSHAPAVADTLERLGHSYAALGRLEHTRAVWRQASEMYRQQERIEEVERIERELIALNLSATT